MTECISTPFFITVIQAIGELSRYQAKMEKGDWIAIGFKPTNRETKTEIDVLYNKC